MSFASRARDFAYASFLLAHMLAALLVDSQIVLPPHLYPTAVLQANADFLRDSGDPLGPHALSKSYRWYAVLLGKELLIDIPILLIGAYALIRDRKATYPLLIAYCATTVVATTQCLVQIIYGQERIFVSDKQVRILLMAYGPWIVVPAIMLIDLLARSSLLIQQAARYHSVPALRKND